MESINTNQKERSWEEIVADYLKTVKFTAVLDQNISNRVTHLRGLGLTGKRELLSRLRTSYTEVYPNFVELFQTTFEKEDIEALITFYKNTELGKMVIEVMPNLVTAMSKIFNMHMDTVQRKYLDEQES